MEAKMESLELEDNGEHQASLEASLASDVIYDDSPVCPCIGSEHQAEIPNLATEDERCQLMTGSLDSCMVLGYDYPIVVGLAIPILWAPPSEVNKEKEELRRQHSSETEARASSRDEESRVTLICPTSNNTSECDSTFKDPHPVVPVDQIESDSNQAHDEILALCSTREGLNFTNKPTMQQREIEQFTPLPDSSSSLWSDLEAECFLLGLYIFGKNLSLLSRFLGSKTVGDVLSYYYGKFYKRDAYKRWSDCRKARTRRCILGERIFTGWRQQELISRLKSKTLKEAHDSLVEVFKSFSDGQTSLEDFVFALKSTVGTEAFVEAVGIGKGKHDLTGFVLDPSKLNQVCSVHPDMPTGKDCSSLASEDIIKFLTGDFRRSKTRSNDLFWEAVWPRLLARGWHSEQPKDVSTTKNCLVFLVPGIKKFSRSNLTKGTHYFDSISDVLKRVAADPVLLELEVDGMNNGVTSEKNGCATDMKLNIDGPFDGFQELPKFTIIDTSLVQGEEPFKVRELRNLPADANISFAPSHRSHNMASASSSEEQDPDARSSNEQEDCGRVTADANDIEMVSAYNTGKENQAYNAAEASNQGVGTSDHRAGKEVLADVPLGPQGGAADAVITAEEDDRVPHPKDIPNRGNIFDNERLEKVWWNRVEEIDELKDPTRVLSMFARTSINEALEQIITVGEYHRQLMQLRQQKAELCEQAEKWFKSDEKSLADALDHEKVETQRLGDENLDLMRKLQEASSATLDLQSEINNKEVEMGKLKTEVNEKALVILELSRSAKEKDQVIKSWEEQTAKKDASNDNEFKQLDSRLAEQAVEIKRLHEAAARSQEEMKSMKINLQDNISLLNIVLRGLGAKEVTHLEDTMIVHTSAIREQVGAVEELITTMKANQVDSLREAAEGAVGYVLAKLKAHDRNINLQPIEDDFDCSEAEATRLIEEVKPVSQKVAEEMQIEYHSSE